MIIPIKVEIIIDQTNDLLRQQTCDETGDVRRIFEENKSFFKQLFKQSRVLNQVISKLKNSKNERNRVEHLNQLAEKLNVLIETVSGQMRTDQRKAFEEFRKTLPNASPKDQAQRIVALLKQFIQLDLLSLVNVIPNSEDKHVIQEVTSYNQFIKAKSISPNFCFVSSPIPCLGIKLDSQTPFFDYLSPEITQQIFSFLDPDCLKTVSLVCKNWFTTVEHMKELSRRNKKRKIELLQLQPEKKLNPLTNDIILLTSWLKSDTHDQEENQVLFLNLSKDSQAYIITVVLSELSLELSKESVKLSKQEFFNPNGFLSMDKRITIIKCLNLELHLKLQKEKAKEEELSILNCSPATTPPPSSPSAMQLMEKEPFQETVKLNPESSPDFLRMSESLKEKKMNDFNKIFNMQDEKFKNEFFKNLGLWLKWEDKITSNNFSIHLSNLKIGQECFNNAFCNEWQCFSYFGSNSDDVQRYFQDVLKLCKK